MNNIIVPNNKKIFLPEEKNIFEMGNKNSKEIKIIDPVKTLEKRTRSKALDYVIKGRLMNDLEVKDSPLHQSYVKSTACNGTLTQEEGKIKAFYCWNRWCCVCNRVRTGILLNKYEPLLKEWDDKYFVSLTLRNPTAAGLAPTIDEMIKIFGHCAMSIKQTQKLDFQALRKMEVTYNVDEDTYHPHFHIIVKGEEQAEFLKEYWLHKVNKCDGRAVEVAQDVTVCDDDTTKELFKYFTKLLSDQMLYPKVLDTIFQAIKGRRTFQSYLPKEIQQQMKQKIEDEEIILDRSTSAIRRLDETIYWDYIPQVRNYMDEKTGEFLTMYQPSKSFEKLLNNIEGPKKEVVEEVSIEDVESKKDTSQKSERFEKNIIEQIAGKIEANRKNSFEYFSLTDNLENIELEFDSNGLEVDSYLQQSSIVQVLSCGDLEFGDGRLEEIFHVPR